jgi:hypothetical protein
MARLATGVKRGAKEDGGAVKLTQMWLRGTWLRFMLVKLGQSGVRFE